MLKVGYAMTDLDGRFVGADPRYCALVGYSPEELFGTTILGITFAEDLAENLSLLERLREFGEPFSIRKRYRRRNGSLIWGENHVSKLGESDGRERLVATSRFVSLDSGHDRLLTRCDHAIEEARALVEQSQVIREAYASARMHSKRR